MPDEPKIIPPYKRPAVLNEYFDEVADLSMLPREELTNLLERQLDALNVQANHAALRVIKELKDPELTGEAREAAVKEMMGYGMFADSVARQRQGLQKALLLTAGVSAEKKPMVEIPATLDNKSWDDKYANKFIEKTGKVKSN